ncbi:MAG: fibronectin type III domain-containing protein [Candidatus Odinarchaeota archaeon]
MRKIRFNKCFRELSVLFPLILVIIISSIPVSAAPQLVSPADGATISDNTPTLDWNGIKGATGYHVQVDDNSDMSSPFVDDDTLDASTTDYTTSTLAAGTYYWRVYDIQATGSWTAIWSFTVSTTLPSFPLNPELVSPSNSDTVTDDTPTLDWNIPRFANSFHLQVADIDDFSSLIIDTTTSSGDYTPGSSLSDDTYYWRVRAKNDTTSWSSWSAEWSFTVSTSLQPFSGIPLLDSPADGETLATTTPAFNWTIPKGANLFHLQIADIVDFSSLTVDITVTDSDYTPAAALTDGTYFWRVRAKNDTADWGTWSAERSFIIDMSFADTPTLVSPGNGATITDDSPTFDWNDLTGATNYHLQVDNDSDFSSFEVNVTTSLGTSEYTVPLYLSEDSYYWRVRAADDSLKWGAWSETWIVTIDTGIKGYSSLDVSTFIGGPNWDGAFDIAIDKNGNKWITGYTESATGFPITPDAFNGTQSGYHDAFLLKFAPNGSTLLYSTYIGGWYEDKAHALEIDPDGNVWICGQTSSGPPPLPTTPYIPFPTTPDAHNSVHSDNNGNDIFLSKFAPNGALLYSTLIGGIGEEECKALSIDSNGNIWLLGSTDNSTDFPTTTDTFNCTRSDNNLDLFLCKFSSTGILLQSTLVGGSLDEYGRAIDFDDEGNVWFIGFTYSDNFPITADALNSTFEGGISGFICQYDQAGQNLLYSSYLGGSESDRPLDIKIGVDKTIWLAGYTNSSDFPVTANAYDASYNGGDNDGFVCQVDSTGKNLLYSTFIGGSLPDFMRRIAIDPAGDVWISGTVDSYDFPTTPNALYRTRGGGSSTRHDIILLKIDANSDSIVYSTFIGGSLSDYGEYLVIDSDWSIWMSGYEMSTDFPFTADAYDPDYNGGVSDAYLLSISLYSKPLAPQDPSATVQDQRVTLTWSSPLFNGNSPITAYKIYRSITSGTQGSYIDQTTELSFTDLSLSVSGTYYYTVTAVNEFGEGFLSAEASALVLFPYSEIVALLSPQKGAVVDQSSPSFAWTSLTTASSYHIQISSTGDFSSLVLDETASTPEYTSVTPLSDGPYYWRVRARNEVTLWGSWSEIWLFTVDTASVSEHILSSPDITYPKGGESLSGTVLIQWTAATDSLGHSVTYEVYYSPDNGMSWILIVSDLNSDTVSLNWDTTKVPNGDDYLINVVATCSETQVSEDYSDSTFTINNEHQITTTDTTTPETSGPADTTSNGITSTTTKFTSPGWPFLICILSISIVISRRKLNKKR